MEFADRGKRLRLTVQRLTPSNAGTYTCKAKNHLGHDEKSSVVTVECTPFTASFLFFFFFFSLLFVFIDILL